MLGTSEDAEVMPCACWSRRLDKWIIKWIATGYTPEEIYARKAAAVVVSYILVCDMISFRQNQKSMSTVLTVKLE